MKPVDPNGFIKYGNRSSCQHPALIITLLVHFISLIFLNQTIKRINSLVCIIIMICLLPVYSYAGQVRIGAIFSQTGIAATHNEPLISMVQLAVEDINRAGGLLNNPVQLILLDNQSTPIGNDFATREAINMDVTAVIGAHWSSHSLIMAPLLQQAGIPMISPGSTNPEITLIGNYIFRACFLDSFQGEVMARFAIENLKAKTAAIVQNMDEAYSVELADFFGRSFKDQGGQVIIDSNYRGKAVDFENEINLLLKYPTDVVYLPGYTRDSGLFVRQAKQMGVTATFLGGDAWDEIAKIAGNSIDGCYQSAPWHPDSPSDRTRYLKQLYERKFHKPITNISAPLAYDAVHLLAHAVKTAQSTDRKLIRRALAEIRNFQGVTGSISFDENGDPINKDVIIIRFENKKPVYHQTIKAETN